MYLIDTNIWIERLLDQERSEEVGRFLGSMPSNLLFITDFSFDSIGVVMGRLDRMNAYLNFINDLFIYGAVSIIRLGTENMQRLAQVMEQFKLDFDDACQYTAAEMCDLTIMNFDSDFDIPELGRKMPCEVA